MAHKTFMRAQVVEKIEGVEFKEYFKREGGEFKQYRTVDPKCRPLVHVKKVIPLRH